MTVFDDLEAEQDAIEGLLAGLDRDALLAPSAAAGWSIADVVLHLAQSEEAVVATTSGAASLVDSIPVEGDTIDEIMDNRVRAQRGEPLESVARWRAARRDALAALRAADPDARFPWAAAPLRAQALATTRLAEHWAHALDIAEPLGADYPDTDRLRHVAWLAHRTLPYSFQVAGEQGGEVYCRLTAPDGETEWEYGDPAAGSTITGAAAAFCRVAAQRVAPGQSGLATSGPHGGIALRVLRTYAA